MCFFRRRRDAIEQRPGPPRAGEDAMLWDDMLRTSYTGSGCGVSADACPRLDPMRPARAAPAWTRGYRRASSFAVRRGRAAQRYPNVGAVLRADPSVPPRAGRPAIRHGRRHLAKRPTHDQLMAFRTQDDWNVVYPIFITISTSAA
jgi:hypothetical protein